MKWLFKYGSDHHWCQQVKPGFTTYQPQVKYSCLEVNLEFRTIKYEIKQTKLSFDPRLFWRPVSLANLTGTRPGKPSQETSPAKQQAYRPENFSKNYFEYFFENCKKIWIFKECFSFFFLLIFFKFFFKFFLKLEAQRFQRGCTMHMNWGFLPPCTDYEVIVT